LEANNHGGGVKAATVKLMNLNFYGSSAKKAEGAEVWAMTAR
jgi:hypothetical protein